MTFFIFLFGLAVGSFLNVLIYRLPQEKKIGGRSACPKCGHRLSWEDLVPLLSFILLRGRCRYCHKKISFQYPIVELASGILFVFLTVWVLNFEFEFLNLFGIWSLEFGVWIKLVYLLFITSCLIVIFVSDLKYYIIPDEIIWWGIGGTLIYQLFRVLDFEFWSASWRIKIENWQSLGFYLLTALAASLFFLLIVVATRGKGMGLGDVKLVFFMGLILGWPKILIALLLAFVSGALVGIGLILAGRATMKSQVPFGTFLAASTFLVMIWGEQILTQYLNLLG